MLRHYKGEDFSTRQNENTGADPANSVTGLNCGEAAR